ncbi:hypothetical protein KHS38_00600 [Mucilaginibacter sp. Bleaf8]|uniref:S41 family peptidase n=1 Tax=Mucilaginibacter sp. Bleaf8 TaxID=2834430 RepID=UPI001BCA7E7B|nr:S41 family peptidase [Mucilaginibacter sp. Bleaf8]MBS7562887.1 hypothetical protein [Mucilaginibacter sp. Bleaf8]
MKRFLPAIVLFAVAFTSCKKDKKSDPASALDLYRDTIASYAKEVYLWNDAIPGSFNPRSYTGSSDLDALQKEVNAISQFKINPSTNKPFEYTEDYPGEAKYSYVDDGTAATEIGGTAGDFGFGLTYIALNDLRIRYVYANSSAAAQNVVRGYRVTAVNDQSVALTTGNSSDPAWMNVSKALSSKSVKLTLQRPDFSTFSVNVNRTSYTINPVLKYTVATTAGGKKVGYFAFGTFTLLTNAQAYIDAAFNYFATQNISELVVDLRYNGGGAVQTSQYLANLIVPAAKNGAVMFTENFNSRMQKNDIPLLRKKYGSSIEADDFSIAKNTYTFSKKGSLNLNRVFFLVTGNTASASELLINNLKPTMNVQVIGETTYGKPVGFFGLPDGPYDVYLAMFESRNSANQADFYQGMIPGSANFPGKAIYDDLTKDFGDPQEGYLATALNYIDKGNYSTTSVKTLSVSAGSDRGRLNMLNSKFEANKFKGLIDSRLLPARRR